MINLHVWLNEFLKVLNESFGERVWFAGLQGSYGRGEANEKSDIDVVVILDELTAGDIQAYHAMLDTLPHREKICGFLAGESELLNWESSDLFQFYHDTTAIKGSLAKLLPLIDECAIERAVKVGLCNLYHGCVHNMLYEKSEDILLGLYKSAVFVLQAIVFLETEMYIRRQADLVKAVPPEDGDIVTTFLHLKNGGKVEFQSVSEILFNWCRNHINNNEKREVQI